MGSWAGHCPHAADLQARTGHGAQKGRCPGSDAAARTWAVCERGWPSAEVVSARVRENECEAVLWMCLEMCMSVYKHTCVHM